jgi:hypothetical protein
MWIIERYPVGPGSLEKKFWKRAIEGKGLKKGLEQDLL